MIKAKLNLYEKERELIFEKNEYKNKGINIRAIVKEKENGCEYYDLWCDITVWLEPLTDNKAYIDTNNCNPEIINFLEKEGYIKATGTNKVSGFCTYPLYEITKKFLQEVNQ